MKKPRVAVVVGSQRDWWVMGETRKVLDYFEIVYLSKVLSAHRTPQELVQFAEGAQGQGLEVIIAGAGMAAHLAGAIAARTVLPVIGVPLVASELGGQDALLSTVQMPGGVPVATVSIGVPGAKNAAILAAEILALKDENLKHKIIEFRKGGSKIPTV